MNQQELQKAQKVARLIIGYLKNDLTAQERKELDDWLLESMDNIALFERLTDENNIDAATEWFKRLDEQVALLNVKTKIRNGQRSKLYPLIWVAAASIVIAAGYWLFSSDRRTDNYKKQPVIAQNTEVTAGSQKATLITASGKRIELSTPENRTIDAGEGAQVSQQQDQLVYKEAAQASVNTLDVPAGGQYKIVLADGTKVWLNSMSKLKYPTGFSHNPRRVVELEGEAYFEVAKNTDQPFVVRFDKATIHVTATSFNVNSYEHEAQKTVTLLEGGINITANGKTVFLHPWQDGIIQANEPVSVRNNSLATESIAWTKGLFSFNKAPIDEVMNQIARWYDVKVVYEGKPPKQFTGNIPMKSTIQTALQMLEISGNVDLTLSGKTVIVRP